MTDVRDRLALALDLPDLDEAVKLADRVSRWFGVAKVGLELYTAAGPDAITAFTDRGLDVFLDIKLYDIPTTVERAAAVAGRLGVRYLNAHAIGGDVVLRAAAEGFRSTAPANAALLAVTVLTSDADTSAFTTRLHTAIDAGCGGVVCSAHEVEEIARVAPPGFVTMVPGIRPAGTARDEQARVATPGDAIRAGSSVIILGRAVTRADDPERAASGIYDEVTHALEI